MDSTEPDDSASCRFFLVLESPKDGATAPRPAEFEETLRRLTGDPQLRCVNVGSGSVQLTIESSWSGFFALEESIVQKKCEELHGQRLLSCDLVVTAGFIDRFCKRQAGDPLIRIFTRRLGPVFDSAVRQILRQAPWSRYEATELVQEIWVDFFVRARHILTSYDVKLGRLETYLAQVARNKARDFLRRELRREYVRERPAEATAATGEYHQRIVRMETSKLDNLFPPGDPASFNIDAVGKQELDELRQAFRMDCEGAKNEKERQNWQFFLDVYYEGMAVEDLERKYDLKTDAVYKRCQRLRERLQTLWRKLHP